MKRGLNVEVLFLPCEEWKAVGRRQTGQCWELACCHLPSRLKGWPHWPSVEPGAWPPALLPGALSLGTPKQSPWDLEHLHRCCATSTHVISQVVGTCTCCFILLHSSVGCQAASTGGVLWCSPHARARIHLLYQGGIDPAPSWELCAFARPGWDQLSAQGW